jgi:hypothetical protein
MRSFARDGWSSGFAAEWTVVTSRGRTLALFIFVIVGIWTLPASNAKADLQAGCTQSGATVTCSYATQGQRGSFEVPAGVTSLGIYAVGGSGGASLVLAAPKPYPGGRGAIVGTSLSVSPDSVLSIQVAGDGTSAPGAGGGGAGCTGGGGASSVSTSSGPLVIAAGGGGEGCSGSGAGGYYGTLFGGPGGAAGADGTASGYGNAGGGAAGTSTAGGTAGAGGSGIVNGNSGVAGAAGVGGAGGNGATGAGAGGGGGGGGLYGGSGGGQGASDMFNGAPATEPGGGGGGGSSLVPAGGSLGTNTLFFPVSPMVVISYNAPTSPGGPPPFAVLPPGSPGTRSVPAGVARVTLTSVSQSHARWRRGAKLPKVATFAQVRKPPVGTTFRFTLSGAARVRFAFTQTRPGRTERGHCVARTAKNRLKRPCLRTVTASSFSFSAGVGAYSVRFQGRISGSRKLKPGTYTVFITASNTAGSTTTRLRFTIVSYPVDIGRTAAQTTK